MTSMRVTALPFVRLADLEPVLAEELTCWKQQLHWDYEPSVELIRRHISLRALSGFALLDRVDRPVGYSYSLVDRRVGYVGNVFICQSQATLGAYRLLIEALLDELLRKPAVRRIEGQVFPFNLEFGSIFQAEGLGLIHRQYLVRDLADPISTSHLQPGYGIDSWDPSYTSETAQVIFRSYQGSMDSELCVDYQSSAGCRRFVSNLVTGPGCGQFSSRRSLLIKNSNGLLVAVLLVSVIAARTVMIPQISVLPSHQGRGLGTLLLSSFLRRNRPEIDRVALSVSTGNGRALRLYKKLGFRSAKDFFGLVLERPAPRRLSE